MQYKEVYFNLESDFLKFIDDHWDRVVDGNVSTNVGSKYCVVYAKESVSPNIVDVASNASATKMNSTKPKKSV